MAITKNELERFCRPLSVDDRDWETILLNSELL